MEQATSCRCGYVFGTEAADSLQPPPLPPGVFTSGTQRKNLPAPLNPLIILRDVAIVWGLTFLGGFVIGFAAGFTGAAQDPARMLIFREVGIVLNAVLAVTGFVIVGCLKGGNRWQHLCIVALLAWASGLLNLLFGETPVQWMLGLPFVFIYMAVGGGISYLIRSD
jgi:hypothetical protein